MKGNFNAIINSDKPVLVDFYADWCQPCRIQSPILEEVAREMRDKIKVIKINVDTNQEVAQRYKVMSIPTLILFRNGEAKWRQAGVTSRANVIYIVSQHVN